MHTFEFIRPSNPAAAVSTAAQAKTAQQGADIRFVGGGTTLIDLMKLNVETPARVLDINRLALDKIEATKERAVSERSGCQARLQLLWLRSTMQPEFACENFR